MIALQDSWAYSGAGAGSADADAAKNPQELHATAIARKLLMAER